MSCQVGRVGVVIVCIAVLVGCSRRPPRLHPPEISASAAGKLAMKEYDTNGDGKVVGEELDKAPALKAAINNLDTNGDGGVSASEVTARVRVWQDSKLGRMSLSCTVTLGGKALEGATVTFVPEKFLGDEIQACSGTTSANGIAMLSIPVDKEDRNDPPGAQCGLYRVEISKKEGGQETIPAKYNTETILGHEVALDAVGIEEGIRFELQ